jgi:multidrug resistance efflux pump
LFEKGNVAEAYLDNAQRDERVASELVKGLTDRRDAALVELTAIQNGTFVGDSYNDIPQSAQRSLLVEVELAEVNVRLAGAVKQLADIRQSLAKEKQRYEQLSAAVIRAGVSGRVWEMMTAPGEHVNAGQELMRLLDCNSAIVTASVSESDFQKLQIGQRASFRPATGGKDYEGWIVDLTGLAAVPSNNAIKQQLLARAPYHVSLKFPDLASSPGCPISRAGRVIFNTGSPPVRDVSAAGLR